MSKPILNLQMMGRFGNQALQFLAAKAIAERDGLELRTPRWIGEKIFQIEPTAEPDYSGEYMHGYFQSQDAAIYTLRQVREWFRFQGWVTDALFSLCAGRPIVAHLRRGDFSGYSYPMCSLLSYYNACQKFSLNPAAMCFVSEEHPTIGGMDVGFSWLPDFYMMCSSSVLLRANSSFSFVAGMLNQGRVFSPRIDGLTGGEQLVDFEAGNHCRLVDLDGFTDMRIEP